MTLSPRAARSPITVEVDADLEDLVPDFLSSRRADLDVISQALAIADFDAIRLVGHAMKGSGGAYGFHQVTVLGGALERAALAGAADEIAALSDQLGDYLARVQIVIAP